VNKQTLINMVLTLCRSSLNATKIIVTKMDLKHTDKRTLLPEEEIIGVLIMLPYDLH
jgi:hypothetical protein